jgi:hypothetical protein
VHSLAGILTLLALLVQKCKYVEQLAQHSGAQPGRYTHFTCFSGTKVQILTQLRCCSGSGPYTHTQPGRSTANADRGAASPSSRSSGTLNYSYYYSSYY